jgi:phage tail sheath protein FI
LFHPSNVPTEITYPGVYIEEIPNGGRNIDGVSTSIAAFAGWSRIGPTDRALRIRSWKEFEYKYGGLDSRSLLGFSVLQFFDNGGTDAYVVRISNAPKRTVLRPNDSAFEDALLPADKNGGLYHLDEIDLFNLLCVPGETNAATVVALQKFCRERRAFLIIDCPAMATYQTLKAGPGNIADDDSINSAFYFPWLLAPDPLQGGSPREFPPCGFVAGAYSRVDTNRGVWKAPAGTETSLSNVLGIAPDKTLSTAQNDTLNGKGINCIRTLPGKGTAVWGARTLRGASGMGSEWKYIPVRRTALFIEESIHRGLTWTAFEPNDEALWTKITAAIWNFMFLLFRNGALQGTKPEEAFFIKCDRQTMTQSEIDNGVCNILVGFAPLQPAEFVIIRIRLMTASSGI